MELAARIGTMARRGESLPYDSEVEWLHSDGNQYIVTSYIASNDTFWDIQYQFDAVESTAAYVAGAAGSGVRDRSLVLGRSSGAVVIGYFGGSNFTYRSKAASADIERIWREGDTAYCNGTSTTFDFAARTFVCPHPMHLFAYRSDTSVSRSRIVGKIFYAKFSEDGVLLHDFIPVRFTNENGVSEGAIYDSVSGQLFRNSGTGAFVIGPDKVSTEGGVLNA